MAHFQLTSSAFKDGAQIPKQFTCDGTDQQPPLEWNGAPSETKSLVLVVDDPDAPNGTFGHWGAYNISPGARSLSGSPLQAVNDFGKPGYGGPCPPKGDGPHHYRFKLLALDIDGLTLSNPKVAELEAEAEKHLIGRAQLVGTYARK